MGFIQTYLIAFALLFGSFEETHEFHVGITEIYYASESKTYQISIKVFSDDLEKGILEDSGDILKLGAENELINSDEVIFAYLEKHFALFEKENNPFELTRIGRETELDLTWIYLESKKMKPLKSLSVRNDMLNEVFSDQTHIIHLNQDGSHNSLYLHSGNTQDTF